MSGQGPHPREPIDDAAAIHRDVGEDVADEVDEVVDLGLGAHDRVAHVVLEVGGAHEHAALERVDEDDPAVLVLEEELPPPGRREQLGVVEHDVRTLGAAHVVGRLAADEVRHVCPRPRGVDDDGCRERHLPAGVLVTQQDPAVVDADGSGVVRRPGAVAACREPVTQDVDRQALRVVQGRIPIRGGVLHAGVEVRQLLERPAPTVELVARDPPAASRERVVDDEADLDERGTALAVRATAVTEEPQRRGQHAGERREDRDRRLQRSHIVRRDAQQSVALGHRFVDEPELAVLEVADAPVDHVRGRGGCAADEVGPLGECDIDALHREVAQGRKPVDAPADDQHIGIRARRERLETLPCLLHHAPLPLIPG